MFKRILLVLGFLGASIFYSCSRTEGNVIMAVDGFPLLIEMDQGERYTYSAGDQSWDIRLHDIRLIKEKNFWFDKNLGQENYYKAEVAVSINGTDTVLVSRAYQMPLTIQGLRIGVEAVREWEADTNIDLGRIGNIEKAVRLSLSEASDPFAPATLKYPIADYLWHASSYYNTWNSLVPYNHKYYHRGEDMAAIPDQLPVIAMLPGKVVASPLPRGDGGSNSFMVECPNGVRYRYAHINTESFSQAFKKGDTIRAGQQIGLTGETWDGGKKQYSGPHLHAEFRYKDTKFNAYPALMEAYFRDYPDKVVAVAGGYRFAQQGDTLTLDGSRSLARKGEQIVQYEWITHTGDTLKNPLAKLSFPNPGLYSEQLLVTTASGEQDRDFLQVRIFDPERGKKIVNRHVMYTPVRNIEAGDSILFWNRLDNMESPVHIDFGDGSPTVTIEKELKHAYERPGNYIATYTTKGPDEEPATIQMEIKVER